MRHEYRDRGGVLRGWRERSGSRINGRDRSGYLVGWYDPARDETRDRSGRLVGGGDLLASLIWNA
jgi:hypothetical protein